MSPGPPSLAVPPLAGWARDIAPLGLAVPTRTRTRAPCAPLTPALSHLHWSTRVLAGPHTLRRPSPRGCTGLAWRFAGGLHWALSSCVHALADPLVLPLFPPLRPLPARVHRPSLAFAGRLHLALFYVHGAYYTLAQRLAGVRYASTAAPLQRWALAGGMQRGPIQSPHRVPRVHVRGLKPGGATPSYAPPTRATRTHEATTPPPRQVRICHRPQPPAWPSRPHHGPLCPFVVPPPPHPPTHPPTPWLNHHAHHHHTRRRRHTRRRHRSHHHRRTHACVQPLVVPALGLVLLLHAQGHSATTTPTTTPTAAVVASCPSTIAPAWPYALIRGSATPHPPPPPPPPLPSRNTHHRRRTHTCTQPLVIPRAGPGAGAAAGAGCGDAAARVRGGCALGMGGSRGRRGAGAAGAGRRASAWGGGGRGAGGRPSRLGHRRRGGRG